MKSQSVDTHPEIERIQLSLIRKMSVSEKFSQVCTLFSTVMQLSRRAIARAHKNLSKKEIDLLFIEYHYGKDLASRVRKYLDENKDARP